MRIRRNAALTILYIGFGVLQVQATSPGEYSGLPRVPQAEAQEELLSNETIVQMHDLGLGDSVLIEKIRSSRCAFDVSLAELTALQEAGIGDDVLAEMIRAAAREKEAAASAEEAAEEAAAEALAADDPNDPSTMHDGGIYYVPDQEDGEHVMIPVEPTVYTESRSGGFFKSAITLGIVKIKSKAVLSGRSAVLQVQERRPTFYFYFKKQGNLSESSGGVYGIFLVATSANEFVLVRTDVKKNRRELTVASRNAFGSQGGVSDKAVVQFDFERISTGIYRVTPAQPLKDGEYAFFFGGTMPLATYGTTAPLGGGKVFAFGVDAQEP